MNDLLTPLKCVLCGARAVTTAAGIPVCSIHWKEYAQEASKYLPHHKRPVWKRLNQAKQETPR